MTKKEAIKKLVAEKTLCTIMLKPLGISFDSFLRFSSGHRSDEQRAEIIDKLIKHYKEVK